MKYKEILRGVWNISSLKLTTFYKAQSKFNMSKQKSKNEWLETESGNRISKRSTITGLKYIILGGRVTIEPGVMLRGDRRNQNQDPKAPIISIGRYCYISSNTLLNPPYKGATKESRVYSPLKIGDFVTIESDCTVEASAIGSYTYIGKNVSIGRYVIIKEGVVILDNSVIPPHSVIPPLSIVGGNPGIFKEPLSEGGPEVLEIFARKKYAGIKVEMPLYSYRD